MEPFRAIEYTDAAAAEMKSVTEELRQAILEALALLAADRPCDCAVELPVGAELAGEFGRRWAISIIPENRIDVHAVYVYESKRARTLVVGSILPLMRPPATGAARRWWKPWTWRS